MRIELFFILIVGLVFFLLSNYSLSFLESSPNKTINISYENLTSLNNAVLYWNNNYMVNISIMTNSTWDGFTAEILNSTYMLSRNYSQPTTGFSTPTCDNSLPLKVTNNTGVYTNNITMATTSQNFTLIEEYRACPPGRYWTNQFIIRVANRTEENVSLEVNLDLPINTNNTLSNTTGMGVFNGTMAYNTSTYHKYYFNANNAEIGNATGFAINFTSDSDMDLFVFDNNGKLMLSSANKTANEEWVIFNNLTSGSVWEIRIYGNSTTSNIAYKGVLAFTTLNVTNKSSGLTLGELNFRNRNVTGRVNETVNVTLTNQGSIALSSIIQSAELYRVQRFSGENDRNFTFLVPDSSIANKVKVTLNWTGPKNYTFNIYNSAENLVGVSTYGYKYANVTNASQQIYNETSAIESTPGYWKLEIKNNTEVNSSHGYNVTIYTYVTPSAWITSNYSSTSLSTINSSIDTHINLTVPNTALNGSYEGNLYYLDSRKTGVKIPVKLDVIVPMLLVNNTMSSGTYTVNENYNTMLKRTLYFNISNLGYYTTTLNFSDSSNLSCSSGSCTGYNASLSYNTTASLDAGSSKLIQVNIAFNNSMPADTLYTGSIIIYANSSDTDLNSKPYSNYTINLRLNLTDDMDIRIADIFTENGNKDIENPAGEEKVIVKVKAFYINGTTNEIRMGENNFTRVWLQERNVSGTSGVIPTSGNLTYNATYSPFFCTSGCMGGNEYYYLNLTIPANQPGGLYDVHMSSTYSRDGATFYGNNSNGTLIIYSTGLYVTNMNSSHSVSNSTHSILYVNISNYGMNESTGTMQGWIQFDNTNCINYYSVSGSTSNATACGTVGSGTGSNNFTISPVAQSTNCTIWWIIKFNSTHGSSTTCSGNISGGPNKYFFNPGGFLVPVTTSVTTSTTTTTVASTVSSASAATTTTTTAAATTTTTTTIQPTVTETKIIETIAAGGNSTINIENSDVLKIKNITIKVKNAVSNISITVKEGALPSGAKPVIEAGKGAVLKFLEITKSNLQDLDIDIVMINFEVDKNWTSTNKVDPSKIYLYRYYNNSWSKLKTEKSGEDSNNYYYESKSPGLSVFAIAGEKSGLFGFIDISGWAIYIIIIIAVAIVVILAYMLWPTDKIKLAYSQKSEKKELKPEMVTKPIIKSAQSIQSESSIRHIKERFKNIIPRLRKEKEVYKGS